MMTGQEPTRWVGALFPRSSAIFSSLDHAVETSSGRRLVERPAVSDDLPDEVIRLWPEGPPSGLAGVGPEVGFRGPVGRAGDAAMLRNVSEPTLGVFRPARPNGVGVIVCPGGGWRILAWQHEGI